MPKKFSKKNGQSTSHSFSSIRNDFLSQISSETLSIAISDSIKQTIDAVKPLALFVGSAVKGQPSACQNVSCSETTARYLRENFVVFAYDICSAEQRRALVFSLQKELGNAISDKLAECTTNRLPVVLVLTKFNANVLILGEFYIRPNDQELEPFLKSALDTFNAQKETEIRLKSERDKRQTLMNEQDEEYKLSLMADRRKESKRLAEERIEEELQRHKRLKKSQEEYLQRQEEEKRAKFLECLAKKVPPEPQRNAKQPTSFIRFRAPDGTVFARRFFTRSNLGTLLLFIESKGYDTENFKILSLHPVRDITEFDRTYTLEKLRLYPRTVLYIHNRT